jgi:hypothetical protein
MGINASVKYDTELDTKDYESNMLICGAIKEFRDWEMFNVPIKTTDKGFSFFNFSLNTLKHGILYISDTLIQPRRVVMTGNSFEAIKSILDYPQFGYDYLIYAEGMIIHFGKLLDEEFNPSQHCNLQEIKESNFKKYQTQYFDFYLSKLIPDTVNYAKELKPYDAFVDEFIYNMELSLPQYRIPCYIHENKYEIAQISTNFAGLCGGTTYGFVTGYELHSLGLKGPIKHETSHIIFNRAIYEYAPTFFNEGIQKYYEFATDSIQLKKGLKVAYDNLEENLIPVMNNEINFFEGNKYYMISGVFVTFMIESWGLNSFKAFYKYENIENGFKEIYKIDVSNILRKYKEWLIDKYSAANTMHKNNSRNSRFLGGCSPLQNSYNVTRMKHAIGYYSYAYR